MSTVKVATSKLTALANAVRSKSGESEELTLNDIPTIIPSLVTPSIPTSTWADGTDEEIAAMIAAHKEGKINLYETEGWEIGAEREVQLSQMSSGQVGETHMAQTATLVLTDKNVYDLAGGSGKCIYTWDMKGLLGSGVSGETGYMNDTDSNETGWNGSKRRTWCNSTFRSALPATFRSLVPQVKIPAGYRSTVFESSDYCFLRSEVEILGASSTSMTGEGSQIEYYKTEENRIKMHLNNEAFHWWLRSKSTESGNYSNKNFCCISIAGIIITRRAFTDKTGLSICGCI